MGCSAAKNLAVEPMSNENGVHLNGLSDERKVSVPRKNSDVPPLVGEEPKTEVLDNATVNNLLKTNNGMSFEIAFEDSADESIIKKHPPKRLQKLEEQQQQNELSLEKLQEKLDEAEVRRQQILQQRIQSAKHRANLKRQATVTSSDVDGDQQDDDRLKIPPDIPPLELNGLEDSEKK